MTIHSHPPPSYLVLMFPLPCHAFMPLGFYPGRSLSLWNPHFHPLGHSYASSKSLFRHHFLCGVFIFVEIVYLAALYWAHLYQELWDVLGTWEWLRQFILFNFIDEMKWCKKKSSLNDKVRHLTVTCIGCNGDVSGAMGEQVSGEKATCKGFYLTLFMNKWDRQRLSG